MFVPLAPKTILQNRYRIISRLDSPNAAGKGKGAMGAVYLAEDLTLSCEVAIKQLVLGDDADLAKAFLREAKLLSNLRHSALPRVTNYFTEGDGQFLVMDLISGDDLDDLRVRHGGRLPLGLTLKLADQLLEVLDYLHTRQPPIIHRDIKPSNLKLTRSGQLMLLDFGIAKGTAGLMTHYSGSIQALTPAYAPPEQLESEGTEARSDLYSFGATFYHLLTGQTPPHALAVRAFQIAKGRPDPLRPIHELNTEVPVKVSGIFTRSLSLDIEKRPTSAKNLRQQLRGENDIPVVPNIKPFGEKKAKIVYFVISVAILLLLTIIGGSYWMSSDVSDTALIPFLKGDKFGFSNVDKKLIIDVKYDAARLFIDGMAEVKLNGKWGFIDKTGKEIIPFKYSDVVRYTYGKGRMFSGGLACVDLNGKWGFIDKSGREIAPLKYDQPSYFSEGFAEVRLNGKFGFIDKTGKEITSLKYDSVSPFQEGMALVKLNDKAGFIDRAGREVIPLKYISAESFSEGLASVFIEGWKAGFIEKTGNVVIPIKYSNPFEFSEGLAAVELDGKVGYIDKTGREVIPLKYSRAIGFSEGLARVTLNGKHGFVDRMGREVIPLKYEDADKFQEGLAAVQLDNKWGFIDKTGGEVASFKYEDNGLFGNKFEDGLARVKLNGKWGFIDSAGKEITPIKYDGAIVVLGMGLVELNGKGFYVSKNGTEYYEP